MEKTDADATMHETADEKAQRNGSVYSSQVKVSDFKADAIEAENAEHNMTVLGAVKAYPMAAFWAFVMSSMIVSCERREGSASAELRCMY